MNYNLQICFLILIGNRFYSEKEIAGQLPLMKSYAEQGKIDTTTIDGAVSIVHNNHELLGVEFWDVVNMINPLCHELLEGNPRDEYLAYQTCWLFFRPQSDKKLLFEVCSVAKSFPYHKKYYIPLEKFVREWTLMRYRLLMFEAYLEQQYAQQCLKKWREDPTVTRKLLSVVNEQHIEELLQNDLADVLRRSSCSCGYIYDGDNEVYVASDWYDYMNSNDTS